MLPDSAVPVKVGVVSLVMSSLEDAPESVPEVMSGVLGAAGEVVSMMMALFEPRELAAPGEARVKVALLLAASLMVPPLSPKAEVLM